MPNNPAIHNLMAPGCPIRVDLGMRSLTTRHPVWMVEQCAAWTPLTWGRSREGFESTAHRLTLCASKANGQHLEHAACAEPVGLSEEDQESQTTVVELR